MEGENSKFYDLIYAGGEVEGLIRNKYPNVQIKDASDFIHTERFECEIEGVTKDEFYPFAIREGFARNCLGLELTLQMVGIKGPEREEKKKDIERWIKLAKEV